VKLKFSLYWKFSYRLSQKNFLEFGRLPKSDKRPTRWYKQNSYSWYDTKPHYGHINKALWRYFFCNRDAILQIFADDLKFPKLPRIYICLINYFLKSKTCILRIVQPMLFRCLDLLWTVEGIFSRSIDISPLYPIISSFENFGINN
jgi:hypothetical protein